MIGLIVIALMMIIGPTLVIGGLRLIRLLDVVNRKNSS